MRLSRVVAPLCWLGLVCPWTGAGCSSASAVADAAPDSGQDDTAAGDSAAPDGATSDSARHEVARIEETAPTAGPPILVVIYDDASAERTLGAPPGETVHFSYPPGSADVQQFLDDLALVGDVSMIPTGLCTKPAGSSRTTVTAGGKTSGDLQCLTSAARDTDRALQTDVKRLEGDLV